MTITISQNQYHVLVINMKLKVYKLIALFCVGILVMLISVFSVILAVTLILVLCFFYLINKKIKEKIYAYDKYPTSTGSAGRNYDSLRIGSNWLFHEKANFSKEDFVEAMYGRRLPMMEFCLHKLFSLVRRGGTVFLYLDKMNCEKPCSFLSVIDKSYFWPCERVLYNIKYSMFEIRFPLLAEWNFFLNYFLYSIKWKISHDKTLWEESEISSLNINIEAKAIVERMIVFCKERDLTMKLLIEK